MRRALQKAPETCLHHHGASLQRGREVALSTPGVRGFGHLWAAGLGLARVRLHCLAHPPSGGRERDRQTDREQTKEAGDGLKQVTHLQDGAALGRRAVRGGRVCSADSLRGVGAVIARRAAGGMDGHMSRQFFFNPRVYLSSRFSSKYKKHKEKSKF